MQKQKASACRDICISLYKALCVMLATTIVSSPVFAAGRPTILIDDVVVSSMFVLWQLTSGHPDQQINSYVIQTRSQKKLIVIDGGMPADEPFLRDFIADRGNHVHMWFISHQHIDHFGALMEILKDRNGPQNGDDITIDHIYGSMLSTADIVGHVPDDPQVEDEPDFVESFGDALEVAQSWVPNGVEDLNFDDVKSIDGVAIKILGTKYGTKINGDDDDLLKENMINNASVVMRVSDGYKSVLFTGDLGIEGGDRIVEELTAMKKLPFLKSDYVQMSHHGSHGVGLNFYQAVKPRYCLWPTPEWLYNFNKEECKDDWEIRHQAPCGAQCEQECNYTTEEVRSWMTNFCIGEQRNLLMFDGQDDIQ